MAENAYDFKHKHRGLAVVIVNETFKLQHLKKRRGAVKDLMNMKTLFKKLDFRVKAYKDLSMEEMLTKLKKAASDKKFHAESDCFVCVISTHGEEVKHTYSGETTTQHALYGTDGKVIYTSDVTGLFISNCPELAGKPKLFFIQACRLSEGQAKADLGHEFVVVPESKSDTDQSMVSERSTALQFDALPTPESTELYKDEGEDVSEDEWQESQLPDNWMKEEMGEEERFCQETEQDAKGKEDTGLTWLPPSRVACYKDELIMCPVVSGLGAVRDIYTGSCMLTFLFEELKDMQPYEPLLHALTRVSYKMANELPGPNHKSENKVVPCISHRLSKEIFFTLKKKSKIF